MNILVTGGTGYIGAHTCVSLLEAGHKVIVLDNFINSKKDIVGKIEYITNKKIQFHEVDVTDELMIDKIFSNYDLDAVIHFAGLKAVGESVIDPLKYYYNNILSTLNIAKACGKYGVFNLIFSSSATVYGENTVPFVENMELLPPINPYGYTKMMSERILMDISNSNPNFSVSILRYFNPVGAHKSGLIGELPKGNPNNIMPIITKVAKGLYDKLKIFGNDYPTNDGTAVRDYIHVVDLAEGHVAAIERLKRGTHIYNLGTGQGTSVLELVHTFERVNGVKICCEIVERRPGDIAVCYADVSKAANELGWKTKLTISDMVKDAWYFENKI
ncbi:UDP-glucose 4-epimerase GalE [Paenibacillus sp. SYP-B4298]|uniref:UDP-glucose 4-epimerase GalE n=1 Tax=Paenibacillus sp. SYP-B4298 TaxID=2996034 RepID=UPI0022DCE456|nr:UDP-glucose 4-epimerase GalE [Paenibacillus sp. SYP-B4298]